MRAIVAESSENLLWRDVPDVQPDHGEVLIKVVAAGINRADLLQAAGRYPPPPGASDILGMEASGVITAVGGGTSGWFVGQEVCALLAGGGYAEYVAAPAGQVMPVPTGLSVRDAASLPEVACTVWSNLVMTAHLAPGQLLLVHGGASGIGTHAVQVATALGSRVAVTAGSAAKLQLCSELGAEVTIDYHEDDFVARVLAATHGAGADVILDIMGASYLDRNLDALAYDGQLVVIGMQGGVNGELNLGKMISKRLRVAGTALRGRHAGGAAGKSAIVNSTVAEIWPLIADGQVRPVIGATFPIEQAADAHRMLASGQVAGKILLTLP